MRVAAGINAAFSSSCMTAVPSCALAGETKVESKSLSALSVPAL